MNQSTSLHEPLQALDKQQLIDFIDNLYGLDKTIDERIDRLLAANDPKQLASLFKKTIASLNRRTAFVSYSESFELSSEIEQLALAIFNDLLPLAADQAVDLLEKLLATGVNSLERCDDSGGDVGGAYQEIVLLWLRAAKQADKTEQHWIKKIKAFKEQDDYSLFDPLLPNAGLLLSEESLRELAFYYETELRRTSDDWQALRSSVNVTSMAIALGDTELYERCLLFRSPKPNTMQLVSLVQFCLEQGDEVRALKWLESIDEHSARWLILKIRTYQGLNQTEKLPNLCQQLLMHEPSLDHLKTVMDICPEQNDQWRELALGLMERLDVIGQIELLLSLQQYDEALRAAMHHYTDLKHSYYGSLTHLLEQVPDECLLLRVMLYRCLLLDLLDRAYAKAYSHGARYLKALRTLDSKIDDYQALDTHAQLEAFLHQKHGRKRSFWALF